MDNNNIGIILLSSERSGSNLLRTLLGNHKSISAPVAPHFLSEFYGRREYYGDLRNRKNLKTLIEDMQRLANHSYHDWKLAISWDDIPGHVNSIITAFNELYLQKAKQEGKLHYCSKENHSFKYVDVLRGELSSVRFVHLVRDPRDYVASWMKKPVYLLTPYDAVLHWKNEQKMVIDAVTTRGLDCMSVKYEDLIENPQSIMTNILDFLGMEIDVNCFSTDPDNVESKRNPFWKNLSKPIKKNNKNKFVDQLTPQDVYMVETVSKYQMNFFNYETVTKCDWQPHSKFHKQLRHLRKKNMSLKENFLKENMSILQSKLELISQIHAEQQIRGKEFEKNGYFPQFWGDDSHTRKVSRLKKRVKYMLYSIVGEDTTKKIFRAVGNSVPNS